MVEKLLFVVDDDVHQRKILSVLLKSKGFTVRDFDCGEECLKALDENPAIVFLDLVMPGLGGEETLKRIKDLIP